MKIERISKQYAVVNARFLSFDPNTNRYPETKGCWAVEDIDLSEEELGKFLRDVMNGDSHALHQRLMDVYLDVTGSLKWWKHADRYWVGKVQASSSTMHSLMAYMDWEAIRRIMHPEAAKELQGMVEEYMERPSRFLFETITDMVPNGYPQRRILKVSYQTLSRMFRERSRHMLSEWRVFCHWIVTNLSYPELIIGETEVPEYIIPTQAAAGD